MSRDDLVVIEGGEFMHETAQAVKLKFDGNEVWIPKSQLDDHDDDYETIVIPEWLAVEKEIDVYISGKDIKVW